MNLFVRIVSHLKRSFRCMIMPPFPFLLSFLMGTSARMLILFPFLWEGDLYFTSYFVVHTSYHLVLSCCQYLDFKYVGLLMMTNLLLSILVLDERKYDDPIQNVMPSSAVPSYPFFSMTGSQEDGDELEVQTDPFLFFSSLPFPYHHHHHILEDKDLLEMYILFQFIYDMLLLYLRLCYERRVTIDMRIQEEEEENQGGEYNYRTATSMRHYSSNSSRTIDINEHTTTNISKHYPLRELQLGSDPSFRHFHRAKARHTLKNAMDMKEEEKYLPAFLSDENNEQNEEEEEEEECGICYLPFVSEEIPMGFGGHRCKCRTPFHASCLYQWLNIHPLCPICRSSY